MNECLVDSDRKNFVTEFSFFFFIFPRFVSIFEKDHRERQLADKYFSLVLGLRRCGLKGMFEVPI